MHNAPHPASPPPSPPHLSPVKPNVPSKHVCRQGSCDCANSKAAVWLTIFLSSPPAVCMSHCCCPVTSRRPNTHTHKTGRRFPFRSRSLVGACRPSAGLGLHSQFRGRCGRCGRSTGTLGGWISLITSFLTYSCSLSSSFSSSSGPRIPGKGCCRWLCLGVASAGYGAESWLSHGLFGGCEFRGRFRFLISLPPELIQICVAATDYLSVWG
jgi:hypothetical protein